MESSPPVAALTGSDYSSSPSPPPFSPISDCEDKSVSGGSSVADDGNDETGEPRAESVLNANDCEESTYLCEETANPDLGSSSSAYGASTTEQTAAAEVTSQETSPWTGFKIVGDNWLCSD